MMLKKEEPLMKFTDLHRQLLPRENRMEFE
jgi:hypothetical protein